jgi:hypothetical protein
MSTLSSPAMDSGHGHATIAMLTTPSYSSSITWRCRPARTSTSTFGCA